MKEIAAIPEGLEDLFGFRAECGCGKTHAVELAGASIRAGATEDVVSWARDVGTGLNICVVADRITREILENRVDSLLASDGHRTKLYLVPDGKGGRPHADDVRLDGVFEALGEADLAVAVGAGTINDLTKLASFRRKIPYLVAATAPSMNGYTSAIAAVMLRGVKRTVDCHQPHAVVADLDILEKAPGELVAAGLGDLESKPTASADFRLSGRIRGDYYCPAPEKVVLGAEARVAEAAREIGQGDPEALAMLTEALLLSGISMKLAGVSSPASGGEHLISHYWDMTAEEENRVEGWHGAQVGVATIVTAALYQKVREMKPEDIDVDALAAGLPPQEEVARGIRERHGPRADEVLAEFEKKVLGPEQMRAELRSIQEGWHELWDSVGATLRPAARVRSILADAGAPVTVSALGLTADHLRRALIAAREIRGRFTILDLAAELGVLDSAGEFVLQASGCLSND